MSQQTKIDRTKVKVWTCKIIVPDIELPSGFDSPPRGSAIHAIESAGIEVLGCSSGWGGSITQEEEDSWNEHRNNLHPDIYFAGLMDASEEFKN